MDRLWTDDDVPDQADYWVGEVQSIRRFTSKDKDTRAPYKPLLLLWLIGRLAEGLPTRTEPHRVSRRLFDGGRGLVA